jgi:hypothetical protein
MREGEKESSQRHSTRCLVLTKPSPSGGGPAYVLAIRGLKAVLRWEEAVSSVPRLSPCATLGGLMMIPALREETH